MRHLRPTSARWLLAALGSVFLLAPGCDLGPPEYMPPGTDHEISGQVLWVDLYSEDPSHGDVSPPGEDRCLSEGFNLHSSRLRGTERDILTVAGSTGPSRATDVAVRRSSRRAYWAVRLESGPPCTEPTDVAQIERVRLSDGQEETVYKINNGEKPGSDRSISALAVAGPRLVWTETTGVGGEATTAVLQAPLPPDGDSLQPDTLFTTGGKAQALEAGPDAELVFWNTANDRLFRTDLSGGTTRLSNSFSGRVETVGGSPARIYWSSESSLRSIALDGSDQRLSGALPDGTTAIGLGPRGQKVFAGTAGENKEEEGIWVAPLSGAEAFQFDKCVGEGKSGDKIFGAVTARTSVRLSHWQFSTIVPGRLARQGLPQGQVLPANWSPPAGAGHFFAPGE